MWWMSKLLPPGAYAIRAIRIRGRTYAIRAIRVRGGAYTIRAIRVRGRAYTIRAIWVRPGVLPDIDIGPTDRDSRHKEGSKKSDGEFEEQHSRQER
jgi:hypothetical protein